MSRIFREILQKYLTELEADHSQDEVSYLSSWMDFIIIPEFKFNITILGILIKAITISMLHFFI